MSTENTFEYISPTTKFPFGALFVRMNAQEHGRQSIKIPRYMNRHHNWNEYILSLWACFESESISLSFFLLDCFIFIFFTKLEFEWT